MPIPIRLETTLRRVVDQFYAQWPQLLPDKEKIQNCKIIAHRGAHDNRTVWENTLAAFQRVENAGVWGIELDIRWTKDLQPVVFHDTDCRRLFHAPVRLDVVSLAELRKQCPLIPTLAEVIERYGKKLHLMVEIKEEVYPQPELQQQRLQALLADLQPQQDYHVISLTPAMFQYVDFVPPQTFLPVAELNAPELSALTLQESYGGLTGHYLLLNDALLQRHQAQGQKIGTGFIASQNCLYRELNRGVEWIFSDHALQLQALCRTLLSSL